MTSKFIPPRQTGLGIPSIKKLEWRPFQYPPIREGLEAVTEIGRWRVFGSDDGWAWWRGADSRSSYLKSEDAAKAAAQADYERRARSVFIDGSGEEMGVVLDALGTAKRHLITLGGDPRGDDDGDLIQGAVLDLLDHAILIIQPPCKQHSS